MLTFVITFAAVSLVVLACQVSCFFGYEGARKKAALAQSAALDEA